MAKKFPKKYSNFIKIDFSKMSFNWYIVLPMGIIKDVYACNSHSFVYTASVILVLMT